MPLPRSGFVRRALLGGAASVALLAFPRGASAQVALDVQLGAGAASPRGVFSDFAHGGPAGQLAISGSVPFTPFAIRAQALYMYLPASTDDLASTPLAAAGADLIYRFDLPVVRPYLLVGPAFYRAYFAPQRTGAGNTPLLRGGFNAGLGAQAGRGRARAYIEGSYHSLRIEDGESNYHSLTFLLLTAGVQVELRKGRIARSM